MLEIVLSPLRFLFPLCMWCTFCSCLAVLGTFCSIFPPSLFSLYFSVWKFLWTFPKSRHSFLSCVQSSNEPIKGIGFCYSIFYLQHFFLVPSEFPSFRLYYPIILARCLSFPFESLAY